jgi:hypothetical protein
LASTIAKRPVTVRCPTPDEEKADTELQGGTWGYVWFPDFTTPVDYMIVRSQICVDALSLANGVIPADEWGAALAVLVITHESWHLRLIKGNRNEKVTECRAIKSFERAVILLTNSAQLARNLLGEALAIHHWWLGAAYHLKSCKLPVPTP